MGLFRLLLYIFLIAAAVWLWRRLTSKPKKTSRTEQTALPMVRCAHCGVHLPRDQALPHREHWYCSQAHLEQDSETSGH